MLPPLQQELVKTGCILACRSVGDFPKKPDDRGNVLLRDLIDEVLARTRATAEEHEPGVRLTQPPPEFGDLDRFDIADVAAGTREEDVTDVVLKVVLGVAHVMDDVPLAPFFRVSRTSSFRDPLAGTSILTKSFSSFSGEP